MNEADRTTCAVEVTHYEITDNNDGLVYNYGNSLSANFTGDAKNVIKIANIIYF